MILKYDLPRDVERRIELTGDERIYYAVPVDIDRFGSWGDDSFLGGTTNRIYIFRGEEKAEYNLKTTECIFHLRPISVVDSDSAWIKKVATPISRPVS